MKIVHKLNITGVTLESTAFTDDGIFMGFIYITWENSAKASVKIEDAKVSNEKILRERWGPREKSFSK